MTARVVGVFPMEAHARRRRLFAALEAAFPLRFEGRDQADTDGLDGAVFVGAAPPAKPPACPWLSFEHDRVASPARASVHIGTDPLIDARLRGRTLTEGLAGAARPLRPADSGRVLATTPAGPVWLASAEEPRRYLASVAPAELAADEPLRARLRAGSFLGLLPLIHLLREICAERPWTQPAPRACFIIDDPNLHALTYGHVDFRRLVAHAARGGYHVAIASTPLDYGFVHRRAAALFRERSGQISLAIHGNNHERHELARVHDEAAALALGAQALRRSRRLEQRTGLRVSRVMCAPHEECNQVMVRALFRLGFDGLARELMAPVSQPAARAGGVLADWEPAELIGGLPVLPRYGLRADGEDLVFRSYLNLPILVCLHHQDLAGGLDVLDATAAKVNRLGPHSWMSLTDICRSNAVWWRMGNALVVRPYARRVALPVDRDVERIVVETPPSEPSVELRISCGSASTSGPAGGAFDVAGPFPSLVEIEMSSVDRVGADAVPAPSPRVWPVVRRLLTESRDRLAPLPRPRRLAQRLIA
ncbi:MAG: hypothetical protein E6J01_15285 [Chloroflexi bacterium]|nr:MAG: hypothetical protein E6J01_15285 [Chloroflexota bacterium]